ncbi:TPA: hypothetical protein N0F65_001383 [Lagenidium giganteum]|uniref:Integrase catalytic domain-containing protein n=1 Tax=Lagenidium giganteum TaxID=4803 RepID=A0AAV2Z039_9STRA|nr:TPA: hypothetical protein N0F65_001383 [Lagenidium giganteum]
MHPTTLETILMLKFNRSMWKVTGGRIVQCDEQCELDLQMVTAAGPVHLRRLKCIILYGDSDEFLLGDGTLKSLGINVDQMLAERTDPSEDDDDIPSDDIVGASNADEVKETIDVMLEEALYGGFPAEYMDAVRAETKAALDVWRTKLGADPPAKIEPLRVILKPDVVPLRTKARRREGLPYGWDGKDWRTYKWKMRTIFREHGLIDIVEKKALRKDVPEERRPAFDKREVKIMRMIGTTVPTDKLQQIDMYEAGSDLWAALCELYEKRQNTAIRQSVIRRLVDELRDMRCEPGKDIQSHLARMFHLRTELASYEYTVHDVDMLALLLNSHPRQREYDLLRGTVQYGGGASHTPESLRELILEAAMRQEREASRGGKPDRKPKGTERQKGNVNGGDAKDDGRAPSGDGSNANGSGQKRSNFTRREEHRASQVDQEPGLVSGVFGETTGDSGESFESGSVDEPIVPNAMAIQAEGIGTGFTIAFDEATMEFTLSKDKQLVLRADPKQGTWGFRTVKPTEQPKGDSVIERVVNYTAADGVATMKRWHERLGHSCMQYLKTMVDQGLVGDRGLTAPNQIIYADLLFPSVNNGTQYKAVLVIMDGWSRYLTVHLLTSKQAAVVNALMRQYVLWAERQAGRSVTKVIQREIELEPVEQRVLTDKGGEFVNDDIDSWYAARGIEHIKVGPKSSHLNPCERAHQSLIEMTKAQMHASGFPRSFWPDTLMNATYIKNRLYNKPINGVPYQRMFGVRPDIHHIRKFGALAYVHVPKGPNRNKEVANAKVGFVLGYAEDTVGCRVYIPDECTRRFVADVRVHEEVVYRDRHDVAVEEMGSVEFARRGQAATP